MACFIILFILPYLAQKTAESSPIFYLNSSPPVTWYNNHSINLTRTGDDGSKVRVVLSRQTNVEFACGFYCTGSSNYYLFSVVAIGGGSTSVVWAANRQNLVKENATIQLTHDGELVLRDSDGTQRWSTNTLGTSVVGLNITEEGNLVLFDKEGAFVWQSFEHPTDALLFGQRLYDGQKLISRGNSANSRGLYYAAFKLATGFAAYTSAGQDKPLMYYQLLPDQSSTTSSRESSYVELQRGRLIVNSGISQATFQINPTDFPSNEGVHYLKLHSDGHLKIYQHTNAKGLSEIVDIVGQDLGVCQYPRRCGKYGLCRQGQCSCPIGIDGVQYFEQNKTRKQYQQQTQLQVPSSGCSRVTSLSCPPPSNQQHHLVEVVNITYFNVIDSDAAFPDIKDIEGCKQACLQNCSCGASFFRYDNNVSDGYCFMPSETLTMREGKIPNYNFTSVTYIKVQIPYEASNPVPVEGTLHNVSSLTPPSRNPTNLMAKIAGFGAGALVILGLIFLVSRVMLWKTAKEDGEDSLEQVPGMPVRFSYEDLHDTTEDFKEILGRGGFGTVFKGRLEDGRMVAVKRLDKLGQGVKEFVTEVKTIGSINHFHLVQLIGFCAEKSHKLLVYEFMSNGSLDNWIFSGDHRPRLDWQTRKKILLDVAKGLAYIHEECRQRIIHLDIKPQNILLDENFNAKVSDFGLSKLIERDQSHSTTTMRGTPGYMAPEWGQPRITTKSDIYSYGVVLLEIVSGRKIFDNTLSESSEHLLRVLQEKAEEDQLLDIVHNFDEDMQGHREEVVKLIRVGAWCLQNDQRRRPSMSTVVKVLDGVSEVDTNIIFSFTHAMSSSVVANGHVSTFPPQASVLSNPR